MVETFLFNIADGILAKLASLTLQEVYLAWGLEQELKKLEDNISTIRAVLLDAEAQQATNRQLADWLGKLKDALYDADDVLDEFQYEALRSQVMNQANASRKVRNFFSHSNPVAFRLKMGHQIKELRQRLDEIASGKTKFHLMEQAVDRRVVHGQREMTHSFVHVSDVIGRDEDKENIVQLLMQLSDEGNVSIIPIIGIGGLGKTTLAKLVYNDERVVTNFQLKMWVCVSEDFGVKKLTKEIIDSASGSNCGELSMDQMQARLRDTLGGRKFLLVLDDVWNDDRGKWLELRDLLRCGVNGSKIIVTTRSPLVASIMGTVPAYNLRGLSHEDCFSLFVKWAFKEGQENLHANLVEIGNEIVKKCGGVPLAVRTLGSLLYLKTDERDWLYIKDNEIWKLDQKENDILPALRLSYNQMPPYLKQCFAYCSIFPKDYEFNTLKLIQLWMAQGLLQSFDGNQELEDIGLQYIKELWSRSFFQDVEEYGFFLTFKMHDLVHDLALWVAQIECSTLVSHTHSLSRRVRHVSFFENDFSEEEVSEFLLGLDNVRTIFFPIPGVGPTTKSFVDKCISRFKYLRVLDLSDSRLEVLPDSISTLKHLRYLTLFRNRSIRKLPNSICKLQNLQTLGLFGCKELEELPRDMGDLISLRCLYLTTTQTSLPQEEIGRLISLRYLEIGGCHRLKSLGEGMQCLTALRTLVIAKCEWLQEPLPLSMKYLTMLENLEIYACSMLKLMESEEEIQGLRLRLRSLSLNKLGQLVALPQWLQGAAKTLQHIDIKNCQNLMALPEWLQNLMSLQKLVIEDCPKLSALSKGMQYLTELKELQIKGCPGLSRRCKQETGKDWPEIVHVPEITLDGKKIKSVANSDGQRVHGRERDLTEPDRIVAELLQPGEVSEINRVGP